MTSPSNGLIIAGMHSGSGKTVLTCMVSAALFKRGLVIQSFKAGPDFIDPGYHAQYSGSSCINLDVWLMGKSQILHDVEQFVSGKVGVLEGVMGLFDGSSPSSDEGSTIELARWLNWPVILIVPCGKAGRSIGASIQGFIDEAGTDRICGVILNQIGGEGHYHYMKEALSHLDIPILGAIPHHDLLLWPERHLGLKAQSEMELPTLDELAKLGESVLDISALLNLIHPAPLKEQTKEPIPSKYRIGLAKDEAFHFYYHANLEFLKQHQVELVEFSPLRDSSLPSDLDGLIFGGGFPEVFASQIADNATLRKSIKQAIEAGMPCYAECGGLMILTEQLIMTSGESYPMIGAIPGSVQMTSHLNNFGYCYSTPLKNTEGTWSFHGHEFHYSQWLEEEEFSNLWYVTKKNRGGPRKEGYQKHKMHASYVHLYFPSASSLITDLFNLEN